MAADFSRVAPVLTPFIEAFAPAVERLNAANLSPSEWDREAQRQADSTLNRVELNMSPFDAWCAFQVVSTIANSPLTDDKDAFIPAYVMGRLEGILTGSAPKATPADTIARIKWAIREFQDLPGYSEAFAALDVACVEIAVMGRRC